jgi:Tfp pilus assembly protein PilN
MLLGEPSSPKLIARYSTVNARLNLASEPFGNRALPWTITGVIALCSIVALVFILRESSQLNSQIEAKQRDVTNLTQQMAAVKQRAEQVKIALTPDQFQTLQSAHGLVDREHFSWSLLLSELEGALPGSVRVTRISVKDVGVRNDQTVADLELTVVSKNAATITQMISDMDAAGIFQAELVAQNLQKGRGEIGTEYVMNVRYKPRSGVPTTTGNAAANRAAESGNVAANGGQR